MFTATFDGPVRIADQAELQARFGSDRIYLAPDATVVFEGGIIIGPEVSFSGDCQIMGSSRIDNGSLLTSVRLGRANHVRAYSILSDLVAGDRNLFGPFCFIRDNCRVGDDCILGAHVETARSGFADGVKISHRAFVGDAEVGRGSIIGAGVVFCNYDGLGRQATQIGAGVTIGSGSLLVPPLAVGDEAVVAAGSTVTKNLRAGARLIQKR
ncbi:MAG: DapH/DapD/GlmU-related protein [Gemmatimonadales bacterium]|nr:DapH/DapD/GlmU-related protein [Gemmatimonadales bacterium]